MEKFWYKCDMGVSVCEMWGISMKCVWRVIVNVSEWKWLGF